MFFTCYTCDLVNLAKLIKLPMKRQRKKKWDHLQKVQCELSFRLGFVLFPMGSCRGCFNPAQHVVPRLMCSLHVTLCTKCEFLPFWNHIFTVKMWGESRFNLTDGYLWLWYEASSHQVKSEFTSQNYQVISVLKLCLSHSFGCCLLLQQLKFKCSSSCNARKTGLETSSGDHVINVTIFIIFLLEKELLSWF